VRAVVFEALRSVGLADVPEPEIEDSSDAVVRVTLSAICGSDLHSYHGRFPLRPGETVGHEAVGVVEAVGPEVRHVRPGDRVVVAFDNVDGTCWYCRRGQTSLCDRFRNLGFGEFGGGLNGLQAERARVPFADVNLLAIPDEIDDERALFVGDILTTGYYGASLAAIEPGDTVAVIGAGPVGHFVAQCAAMLGAAQVVVLDRLADRLAVAESAGAVAINVDERDPKEALKALTDGRGADAAVEAVGAIAAYETAATVVRRGGRIVVLGLFGDDTLQMNMGRYWSRGLRLSFAGICPVHALWDLAMAAVQQGQVDPLAIISHRLPLEEAPKGYELFDSREATKVLLIPESREVP
jgi:alcohol dehydrogenase